jgi:hypothetical protein
VADRRLAHVASLTTICLAFDRMQLRAAVPAQERPTAGQRGPGRVKESMGEGYTYPVSRCFSVVLTNQPAQPIAPSDRAEALLRTR